MSIYGMKALYPALETIIEKGKYPAYAQEVERMRQHRMSTRLEWRRQKRRIAARNRAFTILCWYGAAVGAIIGLVLYSELLRLAVWTVLR